MLRFCSNLSIQETWFLRQIEHLHAKWVCSGNALQLNLTAEHWLLNMSLIMQAVREELNTARQNNWGYVRDSQNTLAVVEAKLEKLTEKTLSGAWSICKWEVEGIAALKKIVEVLVFAQGDIYIDNLKKSLISLANS